MSRPLRRGLAILAFLALWATAATALASGAAGNRRVERPGAPARTVRRTAVRARRVTWDDAASALLAHMKSGVARQFPVAVGGKSLIPARKLASLRDMLAKRDGAAFERFESIGVETLHDKPAIVIRYRVAGDASPHFWVTYRGEYAMWTRHLRAGLRAPEQRLALREDAIPEIALATRRADRDRSTALGRLAFNDFNVGRPLREYRAEMPRLRRILPRLRRGGRWMDMGAGHAFAQAQFLRELRRRGVAEDDIPELLAFGYRAPRGSRMGDRERESGGRFRYQEGLLGPARIRRLPRADVITDLMGVFTYTRTSRTKLLDAYVDRLVPGGYALVSSYSGSFAEVRPWLEKQKALGRIDFDVINADNSLEIRKLRDP